MTDSFDYAIVGMGVGGLTMGALLAKAGKKVAIFDRHYAPGGYGHMFTKEGFTFCAELHYTWDCAPGERLYKTFEKLGLEKELLFQPMDPEGFDRIVAPGIDYRIGQGFEREQARLSEMFPEHAKGLKKYYRIVDRIYRQLYQLPIGFTAKTVALRPLKYEAVIRYLRKTSQNIFDRLGFPQELQLILAGQSAIFFQPPKKLSMLAQGVGIGSYDSGPCYPVKGFGHVMASLLRVITQQEGCRAFFQTEITRLPLGGGRITGVETAKGEFFAADHVIFNGDAQRSMDLVGRDHFPASYQRRLDYEQGFSSFSVYLGLKGIDPSQHGFGEENVYYHPSSDLNAIYDQHARHEVPEHPYIFIDTPSLRKHDFPMSPEGCHQMVMISPCSYDFFKNAREESEEAYQEIKQSYGQRMIETVEKAFSMDLQSHIVHQTFGTPLTNAFYVGAPKGSCYSRPLTPEYINFNHIGYQSPFPNLFYIGASMCMPGFAPIIHFSNMLYEKLTGDSVY